MIFLADLFTLYELLISSTIKRLIKFAKQRCVIEYVLKKETETTPFKASPENKSFEIKFCHCEIELSTIRLIEIDQTNSRKLFLSSKKREIYRRSLLVKLSIFGNFHVEYTTRDMTVFE